jgi:mRNA interferase HigB
MQIISKSKLREFWLVHPKAETSLTSWYTIAKNANWKSLDDIRKAYRRSVDSVANFTVFNIGGNNYRLITYIDYDAQKIFIHHVLTHQQYDRDNWKKDS